MDARSSDGRSRKHFSRDLVEFLIVGGASLLAIFYIIPAQTVSAPTFGLSATMLPMVCAAAIGLLAAVKFVLSILVGSDSAPVGVAGLGTVVAIFASTVIGIVAIDHIGLIAGGTLLVVLTSLAVGMRHPAELVKMAVGGAGLLFLIDWSGL
ncbi:hypothetical protein KHP62_19105 [Rhodobacteraceae bacterium NNCM2]|nr:hypothetical protein [Coraliihabitans acroporae]